ncbi:Uncharacterised protein [Mycobacterium tuberculosis]|nr:Uncharacterised protein [Mycobacterium tuberculosis]
MRSTVRDLDQQAVYLALLVSKRVSPIYNA